MLFEEQLMALPSVKGLKEVKLYKHARKAVTNPETGITINVKSAANVISDCASVAYRYIPLVVYGSIENPIKTLQNVFTKEQIQTFVLRSASEPHTNQLLKCILHDIEQYNISKPTQFAPIESVNTGSSDDDVYGDYDRIDTKLKVSTVEEKLIQVLGVKK